MNVTEMEELASRNAKNPERNRREVDLESRRSRSWSSMTFTAQLMDNTQHNCREWTVKEILVYPEEPRSEEALLQSNLRLAPPPSVRGKAEQIFFDSVTMGCEIRGYSRTDLEALKPDHVADSK